MTDIEIAANDLSSGTKRAITAYTMDLNLRNILNNATIRLEILGIGIFIK